MKRQGRVPVQITHTWRAEERRKWPERMTTETVASELGLKAKSKPPGPGLWGGGEQLEVTVGNGRGGKAKARLRTPPRLS